MAGIATASVRAPHRAGYRSPDPQPEPGPMIEPSANTQAGATADPPPAAASVPARTTPTWEMELLLSGATVFGLLQVPDQLDRFFIAWINASSEVSSSFVLPLAVYAQFAVFVLAITFVAHLCLRGYWVALVGVHSVSPAGMRRDTERFGPHYVAAMQQRERPVPELIEAADNRATLVFAIGVGLALGMVLPMLVALAAIGTIVVAGWLGLDPAPVRNGILLLIVLLFLPILVATGWDRQRGARIAADSRGGRVLRRVFDGYARVGLLRGNNALLNVFVGRLGGRRGAWVFTTVVALAMLAVGLRMVAAGQGWFAGAAAGLPADEPTSADNLHPPFYDTLRDDAPTLTPMPFINGPVVEGPYLRLFIPYRPRRFDAVVRAHCAGVEAGGATLACLAKQIPVHLDGGAVDFAPVAARDPQSGQRGLLAMIPVASLAAGRHELTIQVPRRSGETRSLPPYRILFWR
jgi:hypothetical protein